MAKQGVHQLWIHLQGGISSARQRPLRLRDLAQALVGLVEKQAAKQFSVVRAPLAKRAALAAVRAVFAGR